jgi:hypothetical protein
MRRRTALLGGAWLLSGCATAPSPGSGGARALPQAAPQPSAGFTPSTPAPAMPPPAALANARSRGLMAARVEDGPELAMILADTRQGQEQWLAPGPFVLALNAGRVTRTVNLASGGGNLSATPGGADLKGVVDETADPLRGPVARLGAAPYRRRLQAAGAPPGGWLVESRLSPEGNETLPVPGLDTTRQVLRVREQGRALDGAWRFENIFWLDARSGQVVASRQVPMPGAPTLTLTLVRAG